MSDTDDLKRYRWLLDNLTYFEVRNSDIGRETWTSERGAPHIDDMIDYMRGAVVPEPCTHDANYCGCTCRVPLANVTDVSPPEPRIDRECPLHGFKGDPDAERDRMIDDRLTGERE